MFQARRTRLLALLLAAAMLLSLAACGTQQPTPSSDAQEPVAQDEEPSGGQETLEAPVIDRGTLDESLYAKGNAVAHGETPNYRTVNNLKVENYEVSDNNGGTSYYAQISGLKDKEVQRKINREIRALYEELSDPDYLPPYVGARVRVADFPDGPRNCWVNVDVQASFNDVICVSGYMSREYSDEVDTYYYLSDQKALNLDLNTGLQIRIEDLFADDQDAFAILDDAVLEAVRKTNEDDTLGWSMGMASPLQLAGRFSGIKADQKFLLNDYTNSISLVFDYETPEFFCSGSPSYLSVDLDGCGALSNRFASAENLFEDETPVYRLLERYFDEFSVQDTYEDLKIIDSENVSTYREEHWYEEMTPEQQAYAKFSYGDITPVADAFRSVYRATTEDNPDQTINGSVYFNSYCSRYGDFTQVEKSSSASIYSFDDSWNWQNYYEDSRNTAYVFKGDSSNPMKLGEVFRLGADWRTMLMEAFISNAEKDYPYVYIDRGKLARSLNGLLDKATFSLSNDRMWLYYDGPRPALADVVGNPEYCTGDEYSYTGYLDQVEYVDLGCENLTIFK